MTAELDSDRRYFICPGIVISRNDGDEHFISASKLAQLYGISLNEPNVHVVKPTEQHYARKWHVTDVFLYPRKDGDYRLPN